MLSEEDQIAYREMTAGAAFVSLSGWTVIKLNGSDRQSFLHSFCTAEIKGLQSGHTTEAFILNTKGKTLGHVYVLALDECLLLLTAPEQFSTLHEHLDMFVIREDVAIEDLTDEFALFFISGNHQSGRLSEMAGHLPAANQIKQVEDAEIGYIASLDLAGQGFVVFCDQQNIQQIQARFVDAKIHEAGAVVFDIVRIENSTPKFGADITDGNLPQEMQRDDKTISFNKGCYLGQETVARIDALGHVNRLFVQLEFDAQPTTGDELTIAEKKSGIVTSVCWSPSREKWLGLGFVRRNDASDGTLLDFSAGSARVVASENS
ncbi:MAG: glycine cleavage T C-terminal barrel domain-containing protein [Planctomycetota bacterium]